MYADENVITIKHKVLNEVARLAFEGKLEEERDHIAGRLIPGPLPQFRCCIYKEREIIRQRVRLAEGKAPGEEDDGNIIQVINSACEDCPISSYTVTENCQNCLVVSGAEFSALGRGVCCNVLEKHVSTHVNSEQSNQEDTGPILMHPSVKSADSVQRHVRIMQLHI